MTPTLRTPCALAVASLLMTAPVAYAEESVPPPAHPTAAPEFDISMAGRPAGEGRPHPGRPEAPDAGDSRTDADTDTGGDPAADHEPEWWDWGTDEEPGRDAEADPGTDAGIGPEEETDPGPSEHPAHPTHRPPKASTAPSTTRPRTSPSEHAPPTHDSEDTSEETSEDTAEETGKARGTRGTDETAETDEGTDGLATEESPEDLVESPEDSEAPRRPPAAAREPGSRTVTGTASHPIPVLTLGTGITLIGLGLGFLGLRLRRR
ncbi:hypothetical protein [Streptomyces sp. NPDC056244]|uniref:hypothetical protein n=1 Tax=Streptomyces sp. NPDC056244 TaxID=3345762 RepID=UPI0035DF52EF